MQRDINLKVHDRLLRLANISGKDLFGLADGCVWLADARFSISYIAALASASETQGRNGPSVTTPVHCHMCVIILLHIFYFRRGSGISVTSTPGPRKRPQSLPAALATYRRRERPPPRAHQSSPRSKRNLWRSGASWKRTYESHKCETYVA